MARQDVLRALREAEDALDESYEEWDDIEADVSHALTCALDDALSAIQEARTLLRPRD